MVYVQSRGLTGANNTYVWAIPPSAWRTLTGYSCGAKATSCRAHKAAATGLLAVSRAIQAAEPQGGEVARDRDKPWEVRQRRP
jgi:hypothetical protein